MQTAPQHIPRRFEAADVAKVLAEGDGRILIVENSGIDAWYRSPTQNFPGRPLVTTIVVGITRTAEQIEWGK